ncbi:GNAT family N-acetyltransferase [Rhodoblastus acidophilus]|uniref:GNAT family N-acetyltransferase n=1 Tax=Candidatus Rhodoblastus alkanivorans TaxID=2954117 RepID=A0ABS9Z1S2_9HYPH|nr:GNAT family N-acetyltransferase [Candidatus Rhodoblastus alkanivorans]MCI4678225.1 GNAT family N-acetyltransferase [Candidatus Rhodoblastus alkanivorans]MCI4681275.1 GNAT family N-acetyltransferase [Candidatus Rhodoblastus alkanivorans]MDI4642322.1 GNAT family N-acetyltransferase [Rhodoblastus acidophilus]
MTEIAPEPNLFSIEREPGPAAGRETAAHLADEVAAEFGPRDESSFALAARDAAGCRIGGIKGVIHWRWLYVAQFFVASSWRGRGLGRALLRQAEALAREKDCVGLYLDTFSPRAEKFYLAQGFTVAGRIENFPPGAARIFLFKSLGQARDGAAKTS